MWVRLPIVLLVVLTVLLGGLSRERVPVELSALPEASAAPLTSEAEIAAAAPAAAPGPGEVACALHPIAQVVGASAALLAEQIALQHLLDDAAVELSPEEWAAVAGVTSHIQAVRQAYEASIAEVTEAEPGRYSLLVPPYPDAGNRQASNWFGNPDQAWSDISPVSAPVFRPWSFKATAPAAMTIGSRVPLITGAPARRDFRPNDAARFTFPPLRIPMVTNGAHF
jgi:hypothetical protein